MARAWSVSKTTAIPARHHSRRCAVPGLVDEQPLQGVQRRIGRRPGPADIKIAREERAACPLSVSVPEGKELRAEALGGYPGSGGLPDGAGRTEEVALDLTSAGLGRSQGASFLRRLGASR